MKTLGIHKIKLTVSKSTGISNIDAVNEVQIGDEAQDLDEEESDGNEEVESLKKNLADYYEIEESIIEIVLK